MATRIRTRLAVAFGMALAILVTTIALTYHTTQRLLEASRDAGAANVVLLELERTFSAIQDAEASQRGFLLTGSERYLDPYYRAIERIGEQRAWLATLDAVRHPRVARIDTLVSANLDELQAVVDAHRIDGASVAQRMMAAGRSQLLLDSLRAEVAVASETRRAELDAAAARTRTRAVRSIILVTALSLTWLVVLGALALTVLHDISARERQEALLEARVRERTAELSAAQQRAESEAARARDAALEAATALGLRERSDEARRASEAEYRMLIEQVRDYAIFRISPDGLPSTWNAGVGRVLGYSESEFIGLAAEEIYTPEDVLDDVPQRELDYAAKHGSASNDRWMMRKGGVRFFAGGTTTAVRDEAGELLGFTKVMRDQTAWKQTEEALRQSETRYRLVARASREAIWDWNIESDTLQWNDGLERLFGYPLAGASLPISWWREHIHPEDRERVGDSVRAAIRGGEEFWSAEYHFLRADGSYSQVTDRGVIARDEAGRGYRMLGTMADVTERRRSEEKLAQAQRMEAVGRLAGGIAHDLNNMLTAIVGYSTFVVQDLAADDPRRADVHEIRKAADRSATLTRSLLAFARREMIQPRALDLNDVIRDIERMLRPALGESLDIDLALAEEMGPVFADRARLEQVLLNLALNARDAMPGGGRLTIATACVTLDARDAERHPGTEITPGPYVRLTVTDTGHGMDAATLARIFEPFFTTKPVGEGTGLGLATVYGTVKQAGGFVWAYSEPGHGTMFAVYLPESREPERIPYPPPEQVEAPPGGSETVLVVEDEPTVRALACRTLAAEGYRCLQAQDAIDALALLDRRDAAVDLVVTDIVMPGMSGGEFAQRLAARFPETRVLFSSGFTGDEVIRRGLMKAGQPFLQKPWAPHQLLEQVRRVLDGGAARPADSAASRL